MDMDKRSKMALLMAALGTGAMLMQYPEEIDVQSIGKKITGGRVMRKIEPRPAKGCREYFFNVNGEFSTEKMLKTECIFTCFAINDKNATRKFERWQKESVKN